MPRTDWFDDSRDLPIIDEKVNNLAHFVDSMADGVIEKSELEKQQAALVAAMKAVEPDLNDAQHAKVTQLLLELSAYNIMRLLHELQATRLERFANP
jgi:hypothetical protein